VTGRERSGRSYGRATYRRLHRVENHWARLKGWRALASRYDKTAASFLGISYLAAAASGCLTGLRALPGGS